MKIFIKYSTVVLILVIFAVGVIKPTLISEMFTTDANADHPYANPKNSTKPTNPNANPNAIADPTPTPDPIPSPDPIPNPNFGPNPYGTNPTAQVNMGSINMSNIADSTLSLSASDFIPGNYNFICNDNNAVITHRNINTTNGGSISLIAAKIINTGNLATNTENVFLGAGAQVTLDLGGAVKLQVTQRMIDVLVYNGHAIKADGGLVYLTVRAACDLITTVIKNTSAIEP